MSYWKYQIALLSAAASVFLPFSAQAQSAVSVSEESHTTQSYSIEDDRPREPEWKLKGGHKLPPEVNLGDQLKKPTDTGEFTVPNGKTSVLFLPKFKQRLNDLADQVHLAQNKNFITPDEAAKFMERQAKLLTVEADLSKRGYPKGELDGLEKSITLLNGDLFAAMHKKDPIKPGAAQKEYNDPNLVPNYPDIDLKPGSGHVDPK